MTEMGYWKSIVKKREKWPTYTEENPKARPDYLDVSSQAANLLMAHFRHPGKPYTLTPAGRS